MAIPDDNGFMMSKTVSRPSANNARTVKALDRKGRAAFEQERRLRRLSTIPVELISGTLRH